MSGHSGSLKRPDLTQLFRANLERANLNGAGADENTIWSEGFDPEVAEVIFE